MKELMMNEDLADVTLVTEDKKQIKANINILSACSPVFKDILKKERNSNPIMYLRNIQHSEMEPIMQFIYLGEAEFDEERMSEFLAVARSLEIKELCNAETEANYETEEETDDEPPPEACSEESRKKSEQIVISKDIIKQDSNHKGEAFSVKVECEHCQKT